MNESIEPSFGARCLARGLALGQLIVLGPLTLISTILSSTLCCCCIYLKYKTDNRPMNCAALHETFSTCMSSWGLVWMFLLFVLPLAVAFGSAAGSIAIAVGIIVYPCYASYRLANNEYPWPDWLTNCSRRCFRRFRHSRLLAACGFLISWCCRRGCGLFSRCPRISRPNPTTSNDDTSQSTTRPHANSTRVNQSELFLDISKESEDSVGRKPTGNQSPSMLDNVLRANSLRQDDNVLNQMSLLLDLMERLEQLQAEQRKKKSKSSPEGEVTTPLKGPAAENGLIGEAIEDDVDLEYEQHRVRLQMLIEQLCNMNDAENTKKDDTESIHMGQLQTDIISSIDKHNKIEINEIDVTTIDNSNSLPSEKDSLSVPIPEINETEISIIL